MFMSLMTPERIEQLVERAGEEWRIFMRRWASMDEVVFYPQLHALLTRAVCDWAAVPLLESEADTRTRDIAALFDDAGAASLRHWRSRRARKRTDLWIAGLVERIRGGEIRPPEQSAAHVIAWHRDLDGKLLAPHIAAVELINVVRPTVAASVYIVFAAHALHAQPELARRIAAGEEGYADLFVQEVRRFHPFFPSVAALTRHAFEWNGYRFPAGRRVILDLYGTNQDRRRWKHPERFEPERFRNWDGDRFNFIPQGGGDHGVNHRCPGEWIALALMKQAAEILSRRVRYDVPEQDLGIDWRRLPALPRSRFVIRNAREN